MPVPAFTPENVRAVEESNRRHNIKIGRCEICHEEDRDAFRAACGGCGTLVCMACTEDGAATSCHNCDGSSFQGEDLCIAWQ